MDKPISKLTPEQEADLAATRDNWLKIGLSTAAISRDEAKDAVSLMYSCAGLEPPKVFIFLDSPRQGAMAAALLKDSKFGAQVWDQVWDQVWAQVGAQVRDQVGAQVRDQVGAQVRAQVGAQVRAQVWDQVRDQVGAQVRDQVGDQVRDQVWDQVWDQVGAQVRAQVRAQVGAQVWDQVGAQVRDQVGQAVYGSHEAPWLAFYEFFMRHFDLAKKANGLMAVAKACGWVWPFAGCAIITDRPAIISMDDQNRLHRADGPAIEYRDGFAVHAWHGVRIPSEWIDTPEALDAKSAVTWPNVEQRRAAIEILGWNRVLDALEAKSLGGNPDPKIGELIEVHLPFEDEDGNDTTRALFLKAQCGTGRTIFEAVDPDEIDLDHRFDPAWCAQAWRDGYSPADWLPPEIRT